MNPSHLADDETAALLTVYYHSSCADGMAAAWAIYRHLTTRMSSAALDAAGAMPKPLFLAAHHGDAVVDAHVRGRHVVYVDIAPTLETGRATLVAAASLTVLDHHRGAGAVLEQLSNERAEFSCPFVAVLVEGLSGAQIAWDWAAAGAATDALRPSAGLCLAAGFRMVDGVAEDTPGFEISPGLHRVAPWPAPEERPAIIDYIGDRDLWRWALPHSRAVNKAILVEEVATSFEALDQLRLDAVDGLGLRGDAYLRYDEQLLHRYAEAAYQATVETTAPDGARRTHRVVAVNAANLQSEVGDALMRAAPPEVEFALAWRYDAHRHAINVSARTTRDDVDLSRLVPTIVGIVRGGGHPRAAGFTIAGDSPGAVIKRVSCSS